MHMKEVMDWVYFVRLVAQLEGECSLDKAVATVGGCIRTYRRLRARLRPWIRDSAKTLTVADVLRALHVRVQSDAS